VVRFSAHSLPKGANAGSCKVENGDFSKLVLGSVGVFLHQHDANDSLSDVVNEFIGSINVAMLDLENASVIRLPHDSSCQNPLYSVAKNSQSNSSRQGHFFGWKVAEKTPYKNYSWLMYSKNEKVLAAIITIVVV
jgi:hypothetical protein